MKISKNTLLLIVSILFILICGLSYFFYTKYKYLINYINNKIGVNDLNLQKKIAQTIEQYKEFLSQTKSTYKNPEEEKIINSFITDLENVDEDDLQLEKEIEQGNHERLPTIEETVEEEIENIIAEDNEKILTEIEQPVLDMDDYFTTQVLESDDEDIEEITSEIQDSDDEELPQIEDSDVEDVEEEEEIELPNFDLDSDVEEEEIVIEETLLEEPQIEFKMVEVVEEQVVEKSMTPRCEFVMNRGKNKGKTCGGKAHEQGRCKKHVGK